MKFVFIVRFFALSLLQLSSPAKFAFEERGTGRMSESKGGEGEESCENFIIKNPKSFTPPSTLG
jgi:hypothetical protein